MGGGTSPSPSPAWKHREEPPVSVALGRYSPSIPMQRIPIGKPHVWTVDYNNSEEFEAAIQPSLTTQVRLGSSQDQQYPILWVFAIIGDIFSWVNSGLAGLIGNSRGPHSPTWMCVSRKRRRKSAFVQWAAYTTFLSMAALDPESLIECLRG